jgi:hypothetical protein
MDLGSIAVIKNKVWHNMWGCHQGIETIKAIVSVA